MSKEQTLALIFLVGLPAILFTVGVFYLRSSKFITKYNKTYHITFINKSFLLKSSDIITLVFLIAYFSWLDSFFPMIISVIIVVITLFLFPIVSTKKYDKGIVKERTEVLLTKLAALESEVTQIKDHFSVLQSDLTITQTEVDKKIAIKQELEKTIQANAQSAKEWENMTEVQKKLVTEATIEAIKGKQKNEFWYGLLWGFLINILATLTWTLLGNPGKEDILQKFNTLINAFH